MRTPCQAGRRPRLWQIICFRSQPAKRGSACGTKRSGRQILPGHLPAINHTGSGCRYSRTDPFRWGTIAMRIYGPNGTALAATPTSRASHRRRLVQRQRAGCAAQSRPGITAHDSAVDALIALQGWKTRPSARSARSRGRNALDALDALKLGLLDGAWTNRRSRA